MCWTTHNRVIFDWFERIHVSLFSPLCFLLKPFLIATPPYDIYPCDIPPPPLPPAFVYIAEVSNRPFTCDLRASNYTCQPSVRCFTYSLVLDCLCAIKLKLVRMYVDENDNLLKFMTEPRWPKLEAKIGVVRTSWCKLGIQLTAGTDSIIISFHMKIAKRRWQILKDFPKFMLWKLG